MVSHVDELERYIFGEISIVDLIDEADLKRRILELYERDKKAGKNAEGIKNYARKDWQRKPTASNIYQSTLDEIRTAQTETVTQIERVTDYNTLREAKRELKGKKMSADTKKALKDKEADVESRARGVYDTTLNVINRARDFDQLSRVDVTEFRDMLTREQFSDLKKAYNQRIKDLQD